MYTNYTPADEKRFWSHVDKSPREDGCWLWTAYRDKDGYGQTTLNRVNTRSHRASYLFANGAFDFKLEVLHKCDNPQCVNPEHLFLGTQQNNMDDMFSKGRANKSRGESHVNHVLTDAQVIEIVRLYAQGGVFQHELASRFGVSRSHVGAIVRAEKRKSALLSLTTSSQLSLF